MKWSEYTEDLDRREEKFVKAEEPQQQRKGKLAAVAERVRRKFDPNPKPDERVFAGPAALGRSVRIVRCCQCGSIKGGGGKWMEGVPMPGVLIIQWFGSTGLEDIARPLCGAACVTEELRKWLKAERKV